MTPEQTLNQEMINSREIAVEKYSKQFLSSPYVKYYESGFNEGWQAAIEHINNLKQTP